ncbi:Hypothetical protein CINCED_3A013054 [Cinara cedri]|nr:Hypothetical protein CINCED_3A013054 [Cinara cedri]
MTAPQVVDTQDVCASDPNFAVIFAFCERFGDNCGIAIPTFQELQEMLENTTEVPDALVDLHIKLLRRVKKSVHADKWERAILKFCQGYSIPGFWELEHNGYKGISIQLKLRILKTLFEAQFDSNVKFKAEINKLESSMLRSQPLGWDKSGTSYWVQFDRAFNLRVYKEDSDEDTWEIVAKDRNSLVNLINKLSGAKDNNLNEIDDSSSVETGSEVEIDLSQNLDQSKCSPTLSNAIIKIENHKSENSINESNVESEKSLYDSKQSSLEKPINLKRKFEENLNEENSLSNKIMAPIVGEAIEESVIIVKGEGSGKECDTGNPDETNTQNETTKNEDVKKPKLWSIETICSSSKEVREDIVSVPKTGFFFGDDSVPCLNNVSNGESSHVDKNKLEVESPKENDESKKIKKYEEADSTLSLNIAKPLNKECITKNEDELSSKKSSKQSVFNIKVHEEEVQITERNVNEVFRTSDSNIHKTNTYESLDTLSKSQDFQPNSKLQEFKTNENNPLHTSGQANICDTVGSNYQNKTDENNVNSVNKEILYQIIKDDTSNKKPMDLANYDINKDKQLGKEDNLDVKSKDNRENKTKPLFENDQHLTTKLVDQIIKTDDDDYLKMKQSLCKNNQSDEKKKYEKVKTNESFTNTINQCDTINEQQSTEILEQNRCSLNESSQSKVLGIVADNQIQKNCNVIDCKEVNDKEIDQKLSENDNADLQTIDYSIKRSSGNSSKTHDQIETDNVDFKITEQIDDSYCPKHKNTAHNISNIIETSAVVSDSIKINENDDSKQLETFQIKNENNFVKHVFQKENKLILNKDCQIVSSKHSLDKILQKSDRNKDVCKKDPTKEFKLDDQPDSSNIEMNNICTVKSEINSNELEAECSDTSNNLITVKRDEPIEDSNNIAPDTTSVCEKQKESIITITEEPRKSESDNNFEESTSIFTKQCEQIKQVCVEVSSTKIESNLEKNLVSKRKKGKRKLMHIENKIDPCEEKLHSEPLKNIPCFEEDVQDLSMHGNSSKIEVSMVIDEKNNEDLSQDEHVEDQKEEGLEITFKEKSVNFSIPKDEDDSVDETNENTIIGSSKDEHSNGDEKIDHLIEDNKQIEEDFEEIPKKKGKPTVRKKGKRGRAKQTTVIKQESKSNTEEKVKRTYKPRQKKVVTIAEEVIILPEPAGDDNIRRSRRIAEIKIKEQFSPIAQYDDVDIPLKNPKKKDKGGKKGGYTSKMIKNADESDNDDEDLISKKFKKKKRKGKSDSHKKINPKSPWTGDSESSSSENNIELFEDYDHEEEDEIPRPGIEPNVSDHEFSPESDINDDDEEYLPEKRARTAHKKDQGEQLKDDMSCQKCHKSDQPEWILLCDTCNQGWHASCLRPALLVIPDGDWYCPPCRHEALLNGLKETLKKFDGESKKRENEELRRKRLAYVGISLQNVISSKTEEGKIEKKPVEHESSEDESSESESYDSEPLYQLRARRQANVSYSFNDYDDMINEAILETGVDESVVKSVEVKPDKNDNDEKTDSDNDDNTREDSPIAPALLHLRGRKKSKKLTNLDISSDDGSDEDFKGPSDGDDDYEEELSEYSDDSVKRPQPTRRSVRNRKTVVDPDFINDDSSEDSDHRSKKSKNSKKRSRPWSDSSNSEEDDSTWGKKKKKRTNIPSSSLSLKYPKNSKRKQSENDSFQKPKKSKIKYGMDSDSGSGGLTKRRTRGRQITYAESDDSEEEIQPKKRKIVSDEEDEYVLNDEELEAENEDHNMEIDDGDTVASNELKDEEEEEEEEEEVDDEVIEDEDDEEENDNDEKPSLVPPQHTAEKSPSLDVQSVITESPAPTVLVPLEGSIASDYNLHHPAHQRLLPSTDNIKVESPRFSLVGTPEKRKRPPHQLKKLPSPNPHSDYSDSGSGYPYIPDATKVVSSSISSIQIGYSGPPLQESSASVATSVSGGFKSMTAVPLPPGGFPITSPAPYRSANKVTAESVAVSTSQSPTYLSPQVQQVYQTPPPANYSPYPIDYATTTAPLPPPPSTVAFRNVAAAPPSSQEHPLLHTTQQSAGVTAGGDSEFGGLVSYFSSQQEDDFDT